MQQEISSEKIQLRQVWSDENRNRKHRTDYARRNHVRKMRRLQYEIVEASTDSTRHQQISFRVYLDSLQLCETGERCTMCNSGTQLYLAVDKGQIIGEYCVKCRTALWYRSKYDLSRNHSYNTSYGTHHLESCEMCRQLETEGKYDRFKNIDNLTRKN